MPLRKGTPYEQPVRSELEGEVYTLNTGLVGWAFQLDAGRGLGGLRCFAKIPGAVCGFSECGPSRRLLPGDTMSAQHVLARIEDGRVGQCVDEVLHRRQRELYGCGDGGFRDIAGADVLESAGRVDLQRVLVLRTVSNYDREAPGTECGGELEGDGLRELFGLSACVGSCGDRGR